jgi:methionyl-tRNA formyltransferase
LQPPTLANELPFDLAVVVSFGYFLPAKLIGSFPRGGVNVHPSLLPKCVLREEFTILIGTLTPWDDRYRGAAPIQHTLIAGDKETGVSIIELDSKRFDAGRILNQCRAVGSVCRLA